MWKIFIEPYKLETTTQRKILSKTTNYDQNLEPGWGIWEKELSVEVWIAGGALNCHLINGGIN